MVLSAELTKPALWALLPKGKLTATAAKTNVATMVRGINLFIAYSSIKKGSEPGVPYETV